MRHRVSGEVPECEGALHGIRAGLAAYRGSAWRRDRALDVGLARRVDRGAGSRHLVGTASTRSCTSSSTRLAAGMGGEINGAVSCELMARVLADGRRGPGCDARDGRVRRDLAAHAAVRVLAHARDGRTGTRRSSPRSTRMYVRALAEEGGDLRRRRGEARRASSCGADSSTSCGSTCNPSSSGKGTPAVPAGPRSSTSGCSRPGRSATASCCCATRSAEPVRSSPG